MVSTLLPYYPSRPVHVLHVIGLVGAGKTRFLQKYFPILPVVDIKAVYQQHLFLPEDLKHNPVAYLQYEMRVRVAWEEFLHDHDPRDAVQAKFCVGVESSGINQALNVILVPFFPTVLLIHGDPPPVLDEAFWATRPNGPTLNTALYKKLTEKAIPYTHIYDTATDTFSSPLPREFCALSPQLASSVPKSAMPTEMLSSPRITKCPMCGAPFFTPRLLTMHLQRHAISLKDS